MKKYENLILDEERALYAVRGAKIVGCRFAGSKDGESALKEGRNIIVSDCFFDLRYPLWHTRDAVVENCTMTENCRAALWYDEGVNIRESRLGGIKALRECRDVRIEKTEIDSPEFGWFCRGVDIRDSSLTAEYAFLESRGLNISELDMRGKYSFQYVCDALIQNARLDTKDAFWHSRNVTVENSVLKGEYLGWYSENLKFVNCKIIGTQPLCYARGLVLENCEMIDADLAFEFSNVRATLNGTLDSVKNPESGRIEVDDIREIILDENMRPDSQCEIICRKTALASGF
ncbi:MAG: DUF3737 family protein [Alphaproteobacteria bacterium]